MNRPTTGFARIEIKGSLELPTERWSLDLDNLKAKEKVAAVRIVLDTHIVVHAAAGSLASARVGWLEESTSEIFISAVSVWEITKLVELGHLVMPEGLERFLREIYSHPRFTIVNYDPDLMLLLLEIAPKLKGDPADQIIVATARKLDAVLMTDDKRIRRSKLVDVI